MAQVRPKKALGQHFLTDLSVAERIAATLDDYVGMPVLEIGPGMGVLTRFLLDRGHDLHVIEIDPESVTYLRQHFPELEGRIIEGDFLNFDLDSLFDGRKFCLTGNYPYNISSQIFFRVFDNHDRIPCCTGMLQREVAERICADAGPKSRGILSVLLQAWYRAEYLFTVSEHVFNPPPKVKSGVLRLTRNDALTLPCDPALWRTVVKTAFGQRRKTLRNSVRPLLPSGVQMPESPLWALRPEQLDENQFFELTNLIATLRQ